MLGPDRMTAPSQCPQCGCADIEYLGKGRIRSRYLCVEGHRFEVPKRRGFFARKGTKKGAEL